MKTEKAEQKCRRSPFEFLDRLGHEPPELDYSKYEEYDTVQKEFKKIGDEYLPFRSAWLDWKTERDLFRDYLKWAEVMVERQRNLRSLEYGERLTGRVREPPAAERTFYIDLRRDLKLNWEDVEIELFGLPLLYGKEIHANCQLETLMKNIREERKSDEPSLQR